MTQPSRMPRYDVRTDSVVPYAVSTANPATRIRSTPDVTSTIAKDVGRQTMEIIAQHPLVGELLPTT